MSPSELASNGFDTPYHPACRGILLASNEVIQEQITRPVLPPSQTVTFDEIRQEAGVIAIDHNFAGK